MIRYRSFLPILLTLPAFGFTNCEYFSEVTVPASDTSAPTTGTRYFEHGGSDVVRFGDVYLETHDYESFYSIMPYGYDSGGVVRLVLNQSGTVRCPGPGGLSSITHLDFPTQVDEIAAAPGDLISNGRYFIITFGPNEFSGGPGCTMDYGWTVTATDAHGNESSSSGSIHYSP